jgi:hypothetical protein
MCSPFRATRAKRVPSTKTVTDLVKRDFRRDCAATEARPDLRRISAAAVLRDTITP